MTVVRAVLAHAVWWVCVAAALLLACGVALVALQADTSIGWVEATLRAADAVGLGIASPTDGWLAFGGEWGRVHSALANGALGCLVLLAGGGLLSRLVGPRGTARVRPAGASS